MMSKDTLDGMTVEQLRDLAKRAEAAAKAQEQARVLKVNLDYTINRETGFLNWCEGKANSAYNNKTIPAAILTALNSKADANNLLAIFTAIQQSHNGR